MTHKNFLSVFMLFGRGSFQSVCTGAYASAFLALLLSAPQVHADPASAPRVLFSVENPTAYFRHAVEVEPGHTTVTLKIRAQRSNGDAATATDECPHYMEFYRANGYITGIYKRLKAEAEPQTIEICHSYVPESASKVSFGWGDKTATTVTYKILSVELTQEQEPWPPLGATTVPDWVAADPGPSHPKIEWTQDRGVLIGEKSESFYPVGTYMVNEKEMAKVKTAGFNLIQDYGADKSPDDATRAWLDAAQAHGLKAFIAFDRDKLKSMDMAYIAARVRALRDHPALLAWYLFDEPELPVHGVSPSRLKPSYELIKRLDPSRPVLLSCYHEPMMPDYAGCYDVFLHQDYHPTAAAVVKEALFTSATLVGLPEKRGCIILKNELPFASYAEVRASAYIAMSYQSGLLWWGWLNNYSMSQFIAEKKSFAPRFDALVTNDEKLAAFQKEFGELTHEINSVSHVFSEPGSVRRFTSNDVHAYIKTTANKNYVVLVCVGGNGAIEIPLAEVNKTTTLLGTTTAKLQNGKLSLQLSQSEVLILEATH